jgi:hypothetical protein
MTKLTTHCWLLVAAVSASAAFAADTSFDSLERQFRTLPAEARRLTGPLFWLHGDESKERLEFYVGKVAEGGNGCFTAESRPHKDWLGEGWYRDLDICLEAARRHDLKLWIFDEKWWPSGEVGGRVPAQYGSKRIVATTTNLTGPLRYTRSGIAPTNFVGAVAGRVVAGGVEARSLVDLAGFIREGTLDWSVPEGAWQVMTFAWEPRLSGNRYLVDGASQAAVDWYIRTVYQPHYDRFKDDFGRTILGYFYDEPETHGDWGTEVLKVLAERGVDWKAALVAWKFQLAGEDQAAARYQYQDAFAEAWGRTLYGGITRWCEAHGVKSIGHWLEHAQLYLHPDLCAGNMVPLQKYSSMGGIDAVFSQFKMGQRAAYDAPCWQTPKLGSSITHAYGKPDDITMVEIFGARGQDLTYPEMKWWTDHMHVSGVNFLIPHSFNPRAPRDTDCPPYFYNGGFEPRWPLYRVFADYTSRLSLLLTGGRHVAPVAFLFLGGSAHVGRRVLPDAMSEVLQDALYDCDWIPYEVFENDMTLAGRELKLRSESYRVLIVPPVEVIPQPTLARVRTFFDQGGVVVGYGFLPSRSATLGQGADTIARLRDAIWGSPKPGLAVCRTNAAGGRSYLLPEQPSPEQLQQVLAGDAGIHPTCEVVQGPTDHWLHVLHRVKSGRDLFFIVNQNHQGPARIFRLRFAASGEPECWDALSNEITAIPARRDGPYAELDLTLEPNESVLLVFQPERRPRPLRGGLPAGSSFAVPRDPAPPPPEPTLDIGVPLSRRLEGCPWVWFGAGDPAASAPPGELRLRRQILVPAGQPIARATFVGTADNSAILFINGTEAGRTDDSANGWQNPVELDVTRHLRPGTNLLALLAVNATDRPSPAGVLGRLTVEFDPGAPVDVRIDKSWKATFEKPAAWTRLESPDSTWPPAREVAAFGAAPWGRLGGANLTLSPVKADPFLGRVELPAAALDASKRVVLELDGIEPELAARVTVNGRYAGGVIGRPLRLDITAHVRPGPNTLRIDPFAPKTVRLIAGD